MAYIFYVACCGCRGATARFVVEQTRQWYCEWNCSKSKHHIGQYYNTLFRKFYYINGSLLRQQELVLPEPSMLFGIGGTTHPHSIRRRLEELPSVVLVEDADDCSLFQTRITTKVIMQLVEAMEAYVGPI